MWESLKVVLVTISNEIGGLSETALIFAGVLAVAGTFAMAMLQVIKELTPVRGKYQQQWLTDWFKKRADRFAADTGQSAPEAVKTFLPVSEEAARASLVDLATGGEAPAFYDLPIEQLVAQTNAAAQIALEYPRLHFPLLAVLSQGADPKDIAQVVAPVLDAGGVPDKASLDARNRVGHRIQRNLDGIQIALGSDWKWWMQVVAIVLTVAFVELAIVTNIASTVTSLGMAGQVLIGLVLGIVGGYLAPITRDLVAALQNLRKG